MRRYRGHRQRCHDVRRAEYPPAVPPRNGQAGQFVRRGDRPQDRAPGGYYPRGGEKAGSDHINIEKQLREIARDKHYWEQKRDRIRLTDRKVEELEQTYAEQLAKISAERQEILKKAKLEAQQLIADANRQIENTIRTIREAQAEKELTRLARRELDDFRDAVAKADTADKDAEVAREIERIERRRQRRDERKAQRGERRRRGLPLPSPKTARGGGRVESPHGRTGYGRRGAVGQGRKAQVAFGQILTTVDRRC